MSGLDVEVVLAAVYGGGLLVVAVVLDLLARHSHTRAERYRTGGFRFHAHLDAWECPEGEHLHLRELDDERRVARYRARATSATFAPPSRPAPIPTMAASWCARSTLGRARRPGGFIAVSRWPWSRLRA